MTSNIGVVSVGRTSFHSHSSLRSERKKNGALGSVRPRSLPVPLILGNGAPSICFTLLSDFVRRIDLISIIAVVKYARQKRKSRVSTRLQTTYLKLSFKKSSRLNLDSSLSTFPFFSIMSDVMNSVNAIT